MVDKTGIQFEIDARTAKTGATQVDAAVRKINTAMDSAAKKADQTRASFAKPFNTKSFAAVATQIGALNKLKVDGSIITSMKSLSSIMAGMKGPSATTIKNIDALNNSLRGFSSSALAKITAMATALGAFKGPPPSAAGRIEALFKALNNLKVPPNLKSIVAALDSISGAANRAGISMKTLNSTKLNLGGITSGARGASGALGGFSGSAGLASTAIAQLQAAAAAFVFGGLVKSAYEASAAMIGLEMGFKAINGQNGDFAARDMEVAAQVSTKYGLALAGTTKQYMQFVAATKSSGFALEDVQKIFEQVAGTAAVLGLSQQQVELTMLALTQMASKGTVSMEELRQQLGEQIPGAVNLFAESMGLSVSAFTKLVESGGVSAKEILKFGNILEKTYGNGFAEASERATAALGRLKNVWFLLMRTIGDEFLDGAGKGLDAIVGQITEMKNGTLVLNDQFKEIAKNIGTGLLSAFEGFAKAVKYVIENFDMFVNLAKLVGVYLAAITLASIAQGFMGMGTAVMGVVRGIQMLSGLMLMNPWVLAIAAVGAALYGLYVYFDGFAGLGQVFTDMWASITNGVSSMYESVTGFFASLWTAITGFVSGIGAAFVGLGEVIMGAFTFDAARVTAGLCAVTAGIDGAFAALTLKAAETGTAIGTNLAAGLTGSQAELDAFGAKVTTMFQEVSTVTGNAAQEATAKIIESGRAVENATADTVDFLKEKYGDHFENLRIGTEASVAEQKKAIETLKEAHVEVNQKVLDNLKETETKTKEIYDSVIGKSKEAADKQIADAQRVKEAAALLGTEIKQLASNYDTVAAAANNAANAANALSGAAARAAINAKSMYNMPGTDDNGYYKTGVGSKDTSKKDAENAKNVSDKAYFENVIKPARDAARRRPGGVYYSGGSQASNSNYYTNAGTGSSTNNGWGFDAGAGAGPSVTTGSNSGNSVSSRWTGGPVGKDASYLTGEKGVELYIPSGRGNPVMLGSQGPEYFVPPNNGEILNNRETLKALEARDNTDIIRQMPKPMKLTGGTETSSIDNSQTFSVNGFDIAQNFVGEQVEQTTKMMTDLWSNNNMDFTKTVSNRLGTSVNKSSYSNDITSGKTTLIAGTGSEEFLNSAKTLLQGRVSDLRNSYDALKLAYDFNRDTNLDNMSAYDRAKSKISTPDFNDYYGSFERFLKLGSFVPLGYADGEKPKPKALTLDGGFSSSYGTTSKFATGGSFEVPTNGSGDSTLASLMLNGGERVDITPKRDVQHTRNYSTDGSDNNGGGDSKVININMIINTTDPDAFRLSEKQIKTRVARSLTDI